MRPSALLLLLALLAMTTGARADFDALLSAARTQATPQLVALLAAGEDPNPPDGHQGYSPLQFAAGHGDALAVTALLAAGAATEYRDHNGDRALLWAAKAGQAPVVRLLLDAGSPPDDAGDPYGRTPLMEGAFAGNPDVVEMLLAAGADPHRFDQSGLAALHYAAWGGRTAASRLLLRSGANPNAITNTLFETPLHYAARFGDPELIGTLIGAGVARDARDSDGRTALLLATLARQDGNVAALLEAGAQPDARDIVGVTPLMIAARDGLVEVARLLLVHGADRLLRDGAGKPVAAYLDVMPATPAPVDGQSRAASIDPGLSDAEMTRLAAAHAAIRALLANR